MPSSRSAGFVRSREMPKFSASGFMGIASALCVFAHVQNLCAAPTEAELDQFLDLFIRKGFVTQQEVDKVKAESASMRTNNGKLYIEESKWKIGDAIKNVELFGDIRLRFEDRSVHDPAGGKIDLQRLRYAARVGLRGELFDDFYYGLRVDTAANPRSPWVSFGTSSSGAPYQGP